MLKHLAALSIAATLTGSCSLSFGPEDNALVLAASQCSATAVADVLAGGKWSADKKDEFGGYPLEYAAAGDELECVDVAALLLDAGADPNSRSGSGDETPLSVAVASGSSIEMVQLLLKSGADGCATVDVPAFYRIGGRVRRDD